MISSWELLCGAQLLQFIQHSNTEVSKHYTADIYSLTENYPAPASSFQV